MYIWKTRFNVSGVWPCKTSFYNAKVLWVVVRALLCGYLLAQVQKNPASRFLKCRSPHEATRFEILIM